MLIPTSNFHGDMQFSNIIYSNDNKFYYIDWRGTFDSLTNIGDIYYDVAKLYGGCLLSYRDLKDDNCFSITINDININYDYFPSSKNLSSFKIYYEQWLIKNGFNLKKVKILAGLIYLGMSPLHTQKVGNLLFFKGHELLNDAQ